MSNDEETLKAVKEVLIRSLRNKLSNYNPESKAMPFHTRLLGNDRLALYSFIHSLNTNFGSSMFEPVAVILGKKQFKSSESQKIAGTEISSEAHRVIQKIMDDLSTASVDPDKRKEIEEIRAVCQEGSMHKVKLTKIDLKLVSHTDEVFLIDIKTAKPNAGAFKEFKRTMLEWAAATLAVNPDCNVHTLIAIPYNPYAPKPYNRWTMRGMLDLGQELKVAEEFWDFLGGVGSYEGLLSIFEEVGIELRSEIDEHFARFKSSGNG
ncbi:MAG: TdeIII family type II restriction endonuclease [Candidatus Cloacimonetes bacterium]|jgi:type II restriction enzyme|nr:TdeIII family type II restriction endonuclease [Candidatus Cloacimonadota bacterium]MCB5286497.1 TdeIII family type II restriction endonuclease [Candidatus Cloacimonadota bacterium]MCK9184321.1 TdeIII family type II restriction endonuclease [Candidatus Cloacimonadota bacterium]MCK9584258.1 TdeIII family type II restriction endonuclease [Candidatus Cloacimonadota bacterium]MDY0228819.1 TdeIII family type II restriction endonuclease [Candidatus Cloacimonadaceae bacterium]